ncbi:MAG: NAD-dependent epimerase/dehydratase family protein, partial [Athalassotoga sp.]
MTVKRYLITGATGYTGSFLARRIVNENIAEVHVIVRKNSDLNKLKEAKDKVFIHVHDGTIENMIEIMNQSKPDGVFHL